MAVAAVIPLRRSRSCWECVWHRDIIDDKGASSWCGMFAEPIHWEGQGDDCDAYERNEADASS